jgi:hypothetical protein
MRCIWHQVCSTTPTEAFRFLELPGNYLQLNIEAYICGAENTLYMGGTTVHIA